MNQAQPDERTKIQNLLRRLFFSRFIQLGFASWLIGVAFMAMAGSGHDPNKPDLIGHLCRDIGIALVVAGTVGIGAEFAARKEGMELVEDVVKASLAKVVEPKLNELAGLIRSDRFRVLGVKDVYPNRSEHICQQYLEEALPGSEIRLLGISMGYLASRDIQEDIRKKLAGCTVKLLLLDLSSKYVERRAIEEVRQLGGTAEEEQRLIDAFKRDTKLWRPVYEYFATTFPPDRFQLRYYDAPPAFFLIDNGVRMLVGFYLRGCSGDKCPHFELTKGGAAYEKFSSHFDLLWEWPHELATAPAEEEVLSTPATLVDRRKVPMAVPVERRKDPLNEVYERTEQVQSALTTKVNPETGNSGGPM